MALSSIQLIKKKCIPVFKKYPVSFSYLFGSQATGKTIKTSDIDIAVMLDAKLSKKKRIDLRFTLIEDFSAQLGREVDVVILNDIESVVLKFAVIKEGRALYIRDEELYLDFELRTMGEYHDFAPFLAMYNKAYVERNV